MNSANKPDWSQLDGGGRHLVLISWNASVNYDYAYAGSSLREDAEVLRGGKLGIDGMGSDGRTGRG